MHLSYQVQTKGFELSNYKCAFKILDNSFRPSLMLLFLSFFNGSLIVVVKGIFIVLIMLWLSITLLLPLLTSLSSSLSILVVLVSLSLSLSLSLTLSLSL